jgi:tetratricopeptide (TPR) repeat protein
MAPDTFIKDITTVLKNNSQMIFVTPGVHNEILNVRFQKWSKQPRVLDEFDSLLNTISIDDEQIRGLAKMIGESASPQDVDLSLMVLASQLQGEGREVILVTDDFKMTTTGQKANLGYTTCPPSTFIQRLAAQSSSKNKGRMRSLSRRVRAAEMRYAISRVHEYDIQAKLTWMVDSLIEDRSPSQKSIPTDASEMNLKRALQRTLAGEQIKGNHLKKLGTLPEVCQPILLLDSHLAQLTLANTSAHLGEVYEETLLLLSEVLEAIGLELTPLDEAAAELAHSALSGYLYRTETALGLMAKMSGKRETARLHLSRALQSATLIDDLFAEMHAVFQLGLLAMASAKWQRSARLFEAADRQAQLISAPRLPYLVCAAISRHLLDETNSAEQHIHHANTIVCDDKKQALVHLMKLGESLLAIDQPGLALEVLDEAMECALQTESQEQLETLSEHILMANAAMTESDILQHEGLRTLLDGLNQLSEEEAEEFAKKIKHIEQRANEHTQLFEETWKVWQPSTKLIPQGATLRVVRAEIDENQATLVIVHQPELGSIGLWLPDGEWNVTSGYLLSFAHTRVKLALPTVELQEKHNIRGIVAVEDTSQLIFSAPIDELIIESDS